MDRVKSRQVPVVRAQGEQHVQSVVDGYSVGEVIGIGGFSTVYRARQDQFDREVALKLLNIRIDDPRSVKRFENECRALGRLDAHPHIADIYAAGIGLHDQPYIAMRWYRNGSVADLLGGKGSLPIDQVVAIGLQMSDALAAAHETGIIHRDVKPQNILVSDRGGFALSDFGVSVLEYESAATVTQAFTYDHAAPEILELEEFGPASDQYALASTLYTLAVGAVPFPASAPAQQIRAIATTDPDFSDPRLVAIAPALMRAMAKNPAERFATMHEFAEALAACQQRTLTMPPVGVTPACETVIKDGRARGSASVPPQPVAATPAAVNGWAMRSPLTSPLGIGLLIIFTLLACALFRWIMFVTKGTEGAAAGEWLSFQSVLSIIGGTVAAILINLKGRSRPIGFGAALFILVARFKGGTGSLLTASKEDRILDVWLWLALLLVVGATIVLVVFSARRYRTFAPPRRSGRIALWTMIGTPIGAAAYSFYVWAPTVNSVNELAVECIFVTVATSAAIFTIAATYKYSGTLGLLGYAGTFTVIHAIFVLGATRSLTSSNVAYWYEVPLLIAVATASGFACYASYRVLPPVTANPETVPRRNAIIDLRAGSVVDAPSNRSVKP